MKKLIAAFSIAGLLFSGYMSFYKYFTKTCPFGETCPTVLGFPACYIGFLIFIMLTEFSILLIKKNNDINNLKVLIFDSLFGVLFSGYFTFRELPNLFMNGFSAYIFGLPTCAFGFIFFVIVFSLCVYYRSSLTNTGDPKRIADKKVK